MIREPSTACTSNIDSSLPTATHVFVRRDAVRKPLQQPYDGPFVVLDRSDKFYTLRRTFRWVFIVANVIRAIIGADFPHHYGLNVDIWHCTLADSTTLLHFCGISSDTPTDSCGLTRLRTTAYHPIANGLVERFHRCLKPSLKASPCPDRWVHMLPLALLGIRTTLKEDLR